MKQYITSEQYNELSDEAKQKFVVWHLTQPIEATAYRSIGHLIWFLDEHITGWWKIERSSTKDAWRVQAEYVNFDDEGGPELCDALWDAVKMILESGQS
jgi:hypothetical protein